MSQYWIGWSAGSWGTSWGCDSSGEPIQVEDLEETPGGRRRSSRKQAKRDLGPSVEDVQKQWDILELRKQANAPEIPDSSQATVKDSLTVPQADHLREATKKITPDHTEHALAMVVPSIIAEHWPMPAVPVADPAALQAGLEAARRRQQAANDQAILMILAEL